MPINVYPVYVVNLKKRTDRRQHILAQFQDRPEFKVTLVQAIEHEIGAIGLWQSLLHILGNLVEKDAPFIIFCEDDHEFTQDYTPNTLAECIAEAQEKNADIVLGGVSWMNSMMQVSKNLNWLEDFSGLQFTIIFRFFFDKILNASFRRSDAADFKISTLTSKKYLIYPLISIQKGFNYSDVTPKNDCEGRVSDLFEKTNERAQLVAKVSKLYHSGGGSEKVKAESVRDIVVSTYILCESGNTQSRRQIESQFSGRTEFDCRFVEFARGCQSSKWECIREIINTAIVEEDDVIIVCDHNHQFTSDYTKEFFIANIIEASQQGVEILSGGAGSFGLTVPITANRHWVSECLNTRFYVIFRTLFDIILNEPVSDEIDVNRLLSEITPNKNLLYPFISIPRVLDQKSDEPDVSINRTESYFGEQFQRCSVRLTHVHDAFIQFNCRITS